MFYLSHISKVFCFHKVIPYTFYTNVLFIAYTTEIYVSLCLEVMYKYILIYFEFFRLFVFPPTYEWLLQNSILCVPSSLCSTSLFYPLRSSRWFHPIKGELAAYPGPPYLIPCRTLSAILPCCFPDQLDLKKSILYRHYIV